uniref:LOW QUALITY PROTEIN: uncharacterized protein LOC114592129 n=1 Tax=Podarcis muralis TaxID=64176 RepID=UPI0010A06DCC|nr:LOW QUALITY PROTEIN: uncharacterized protein LOC114592129 [Podarcis muralis]
MAQVPEALVEVTVHSSEGPCLLAGRRQRALCRNAMQESCSSMASLGTFPAQGSELLSRLDRGEDAWVPDLQSSEESAEEGPVKPTLKRWPKAGMWWDLYRSPVKYTTTSESSEDEQESEAEEQKRPRGGRKLTILRRSILDIFKGNGCQGVKQTEASKNRPQLKKPPRAQLGKIKCSATEVGDVAPSTAKKKASGREPQRTCPDCGQAFKTKASLLSHQKTHSGECPYKCSTCGERFTAKKAFANHQRGHAEERGYKHPSPRKHPKAYLRERPFKCSECGMRFQRKRTLTAHLNSHTAERPYRCPECEKAFTRKENLDRHQKIHMRERKGSPPKGEREERAAIFPDAPEKNPPAASVSEGTFLSGLGADRQQGTPQNLYKCQFCGRCMRTKSLLVDHERIHREEMPYKCSQCQKSFLHKYSFLQHEATHWRKAACERPVRMSANYTPSTSRIFHMAENLSAVPTDGGKVTNVFNLSQHTRTPGGERVYKCQYCGKCLSGSGPLTNHEKLHRRGRSYKCPYCVKRFSRKDNLLQHKATHKNKKPVGRPRLKSSRSVSERIHTELQPHTDVRDGIVTRSVARSLSLSKHLKTYTESKVYKCQYCGEHTRTKSLLVDHERIHKRKKKPYQCLECGKSFYQKNYLASHQRGHVRKKLSKRSDADQKVTTDNPRSLKRGTPHRRKVLWRCFKCGKHFDYKYHLTRHQKTHLAEKPFKCVCGKGFVEMWHLKRHEKTQLNKKCHEKLLRAEGKGAILNSANGVHPEERNPGELPVNTEPPTASSTVERNILQDTEEENTRSLAALAEASEVEILDVSEQGGTHVQVQVELSEQSQQNSLQNCREENVSVSQPVESKRKLSGKDRVTVRYKQDDHSKGQQVHQRHCSKRARLQSNKQEKACVRWQLRSQAMMLRRRSKQKMQLVGEQARSCFCQQEGPRRKASLLQACKKVKTCSSPQRNQDTAASPKGNSETGSCTAGNCDAVAIRGEEDLQELSPLPGRSPLQSCERAQPADELQNASLQKMEMWPRWNPSSPEACKEVETCSGPQRNQHTAASPKGNSDSGSCTSGEYDAVSIGGQEDLQELSPLPERSPLQSCERAQAADELQNASLQNMEEMPRWNPSSPGVCKEVETCSGPQRNQHTAASPNSNSDSWSSMTVNCDALDIVGQEDLPELSPLPGRSPLQSCKGAQAADELQNASLQNMEEMTRWEPSSPEACKEVETCSGPQRNQHTAASPIGNSDSWSCTSGEYDAVSIRGEEDLQALSPLPERSPLQSCERAQPADELQNASLQNMEEMPRWNPSSPGVCKEVEACSGPQRNQHIATSSSLLRGSPKDCEPGEWSFCLSSQTTFSTKSEPETIRSATLGMLTTATSKKGPKKVLERECNGNSETGSCTSGEYDVVAIGGQEDLQDLSSLPERSPLQSCERAQAADKLQNVSLQNMEEMPRWNPSPLESCKEVETCSGPQRNQHTATSPKGNSDSGSCTSGDYDAVSIGGQEDLQELSPLPERSPLQSCERAQPADELQNVSLQNMEIWPRWNPSSPGACKEVEACSGPQKNQHTAASSSLLRSSPKGFEPAEPSLCLPSQILFSTKSEPETIRSASLEMLITAALKKGPREGLERESEGNSETGSCTSGEYEAIAIGGQEDLPELSPLPERSPLQSCERAHAADELQNVSLQNMEEMPRWEPSSPEAFKEVETCSGPQRNQHTAASPNSNSDSWSSMTVNCDSLDIVEQEDLQELSPLPGRSPLQSCERAQPADELQNASLQKMEMWPRWNPSSPEACKEVETCSGPQRNQHTAASSSLLRSSPKGCEPGERSYCLPSQTTFSTKSEPETIRSAALEMLTAAALKKGPREGLERESEDNSETGSCTSGEYDVVIIGEQEDLQELSPLPERSPLQSCERAHAADELQNVSLQNMEEMPRWQNVSLQNMEEMPRWNPSPLEACKEVETCSGPQRNQHTAASPKGNSDSGSCTSGDYDVVVIGGQEDLQELSPLPERSPLQSCERAQAADELQNVCSGPQRNQHTAASPKGNSDSGSCTSGEYDVVVIGGQEDLPELSPLPGRSPLQSCERAQPADELQNAHQQPKVRLTLSGEAGNTSLRICKKERGSDEPQTPMAAEPQSHKSWDKGVPREWKSEETEPRYECSYCHQFFENQDQLVRHENAHKRRPYLCTHCGKGFPSAHARTIHTRIHTGEKPFKCPECDFRCYASANLNKHRRTHSRESPHLCVLCGQSFWFSHSLAVHRQMHSGKETYTCADCGQMFLRKNLLILHRKYKHQSGAV